LEKQEKELLSEKLLKAEEKFQKQEEFIHKAETKNKAMETHVKKVNDELRMTQQLIEGLKRSSYENSDRSLALKTELDRASAEAEEFKKKTEEKTVVAEKAANKIQQLEEEIGSARRKLDKISGAGGNTDALLKEHYDELRRKMTCSVCQDREKTVVITRCFHMFCSPCIQKNLAMRQRKCPGCGKAFAESDVHSIYFTD